MKCPQCGNVMPDGTEFCKLCGTALSGAASSAPVPSMPSDAGFVFAQQEKNARKRTVMRVAMLVGVVIVVVVALLLSVGKSLVSNTESSDEPSQQTQQQVQQEPQQQAQQDASAETDGDDSAATAIDASAQNTDSVNTAKEGDSSQSSDAEDTQTDASLSDFIGTWICTDYDYDGNTRNFTLSFDVDACMFVYIWTEDDLYHYAAVRHYSGSNGTVKDTTGFEFTLSSDKQTLVLHVSEGNQPHQMKSEYYFTRQSDDVQSADILFTALGWWYETDGDFAFLLDTTGFAFVDPNAVSSTKWWIDKGRIRMEAPQDDGTVNVITLTFSDDRSTLTDAADGTIYSKTPPSSTTGAA